MLHFAGAALALGATLFSWRSAFEAKTSSRWVNCAALLFGLDACGLQLVLPLVATALAELRSRVMARRKADLAPVAGTNVIGEAEAEAHFDSQPAADDFDEEGGSGGAAWPSPASRPDYSLHV